MVPQMVFQANIAFNVVNVLVHSTGLYLLVTIYTRTQSTRRKPQALFIMNIALAELSSNAWLLLSNALGVANFKILHVSNSINDTHYGSNSLNDTHHGSKSICDWNAEVNAFYLGVFVNFMLSMFYITGDRLLYILCFVKYPIHWSLSKTKVLLMITWSICLVISCLFLLVKHIIGKHVLHVQIFIYIHILALLVLIYFLFALFTYVSICVVFMSSNSNHQFPRRNQVGTTDPSQVRRIAPPHRSVLRAVFKKSKLYVSFLLISFFLLLNVVPSLLRSVLYYTDYFSVTHEESLPFKMYVYISTALSDIADGIIYIFLQPNVRRLLMLKVRWCCPWLSDASRALEFCIEPETTAVQCDQEAATVPTALQKRSRGGNRSLRKPRASSCNLWKRTMVKTNTSEVKVQLLATIFRKAKVLVVQIYG